MTEGKEELKNPLMKVKEESQRVHLKPNIQKTKILASGLITFMADRWGNNGNSDRLFSWFPKSLQVMTIAMKLKDASCLEEKL